jgi:hypothetical protein
MKTRTWIAPFAALLGFVATATAAPKISLSQTSWDFGTVWQGTSLETEFKVENTGDEPLTIGVKSSCGCTVATKPRSPLPPGESDTMTISYDSVRRRGPARQTVTLTTNDPARPRVVFSVRGDVKPLYEVGPVDSLTFGNLYRSTRETRTVTIRNLYDKPINPELAVEEKWSKGFEFELKEVERGQVYELSARTQPPLEIGAVNAKATIKTGLEQLPSFDVAIFGTVQPPVVVRPKVLFMPKQLVKPTRYRLRVTIAKDSDVKVTGARASHEAIEVSLGDEEERDAARIVEVNVVLPPGDQLPDGAEPQIELLTNAEEPALQKLTVPVKIVGG